MANEVGKRELLTEEEKGSIDRSTILDTPGQLISTITSMGCANDQIRQSVALPG